MPKLFGMEVSQEVYEKNKHKEGKQKAPPSQAEKQRRQAEQEALERRFDTIWVQVGGEPNYWSCGALFDDKRDWHIDRYNADDKIGVEIDGGQYMKRSGHNNISGIERDARKLNRCNQLGITLFRLTTSMVSYDDVSMILQYVRGKHGQLESTNSRKTHVA